MDRSLRPLERSARRSPTNLEAGRAYARGLERADRLDTAWSEWCRLARAGDSQAWSVLEPIPAALESRRPRITTQHVIRSPDVQVVSGSPYTGDEVVLQSADLLVALDPHELAERWRLRGLFPDAVRCGRLLLSSAEHGSGNLALVRTDAATGEIIGRIPIERPRQGDVSLLDSSADRLVAMRRDQRGRAMSLVSLDATTGARLGEWPIPRRGVFFTGRGFVLTISRTRSETLVHPLEGASGTLRLPGVCKCADERGAIVWRNRKLREVKLPSGEPTWSAPGWLAWGRVQLTDRLAIHSTVGIRGGRATADELVITAIDRATGEVAWRRVEGEHGAMIDAMAVAEGVLYVSRMQFTNSGRSLASANGPIVALDLETGDTRFELHLRAKGQRRELLPVHGALLVLTQSPRGARVERLGV